MRCLLLSSAVLLAGVLTVASAATPPVDGVVNGRPITHAIKRTVHLDHVVLEELQKSNPERYAKVQQVMASASELCAPNAGRMWETVQVDGGGCSSMLLKTSYPPKRELSFAIDDTLYIALVTVRDAPALLTPVPGKVVPVDPPSAESPSK